MDLNHRSLLQSEQTATIQFVPSSVCGDEIESLPDDLGMVAAAIRRRGIDDSARHSGQRSVGVISKPHSTTDSRPGWVTHELGVSAGIEDELVEVAVAGRVGSCGHQ